MARRSNPSALHSALRSARKARADERGRNLQFERLEGRRMLAADIVPLTGDFDGDGTDTFGFYRPEEGTFLFRNANTSGFAQSEVRFGPQGAMLQPLVGDWDGDGDDTPGLYDPATGTFFLKNDLDPGAADLVFSFGAGGSDFLAVSGDFNGNGTDSIGIYSQTTGKFSLRDTATPGPADHHFGFGPKGDDWLPMTGDWDDDGDDTIGLYDQAAGRIFLKNSFTGGAADEVVRYGPKGGDWLPLAGDFDGDGDESFTLYDPASGQFYVKNDRMAGGADFTIFVSPLVDQGSQNIPSGALDSPPPMTQAAPLTPAEVEMLLRRAAAASASEDAIIAVVDRNGTILGVRAEADVLTTITDTETLVFAIDGAVAKARTAAFFANGDPDNGTLAPLNSRLVRFISQSTITEREVESNPNSSDPTVYGPGFVAPIGLGGHFPPEIDHTAVVDLFAIEHTNRDSIVHPGPDHRKDPVTLDAMGNVTATSGDDILLDSRFNVDPVYIPTGQEIEAPESYGFASGLLTDAQSRGIATLPGGIPLYKGGTLVGGIGVFFPGPDGFATHEQAFVPGIGQTEFERTNAPRVLESEWIAFAAAGGTLDMPVDTIGGVPQVSNIRIPATQRDRITLVGIELEIFGPHPDGVWQLMHVGASVGEGDPDNGADQPVEVGGTLYVGGEKVPEGWLVLPHDSPVDDISADDVEQIIQAGIEEAQKVRAAVRLPVSSRTRMVLAVGDTDGNILGLYRMKDATVFSIDVAVAKARNTAYYADPVDIETVDLVDEDVPQDGLPDLPPGVAFTNRTFRFLAEPRFPDGVEGTPPAPFSILLHPSINPDTAENLGAPADAATFTSVLGYDAFNPGSNFRDPDNPANQNGIVFFPGSTPIYESDGTLIGGFGVSGDGVDQDDVVTFFGAQGFLPTDPVLRADEVFVRGVRLPFVKFLRNPEG